jgi:hypothetical protein
VTNTTTKSGLPKPAVLIVIVLLLVFGVSCCVLVYNHQIHANPFILYSVFGPPGQPKTREEAQQRVNFTIYGPTHKPSGIQEMGDLILFGNDKYARLSYQSIEKKDTYGLSLEETLASAEERSKISKQGIMANNPYAESAKPLVICNMNGYASISKTIQDVIFIKNNTRILMTYFSSAPASESQFVPLPDIELSRIACSLQPLTSVQL